MRLRSFDAHTIDDGSELGFYVGWGVAGDGPYESLIFMSCGFLGCILSIVPIFLGSCRRLKCYPTMGSGKREAELLRRPGHPRKIRFRSRSTARLNFVPGL